MIKAAIATLAISLIATVLAVNNGVQINQGQYSYLVYLMVDPGTDSTYACSGGIVSSRYVISAAHCSFGGFFQVIVNRVDVRGYRRSDLVNVSKVTRPSNFGKDGLFNYNDIAIYELATPIAELDQYVQYLDIGLNAPPVGSNIIIAGFGQLGGPTSTSKAHWGVTKVSPDSQCQFSSYRAEVSFCSVDPNVYACPGDSGTPIVVKPRTSSRYVQVGVNSFGYDGPCGSKRPDSVVGKIASMVQFIRDNTPLAPPNFVNINYNDLEFPTSSPPAPTTEIPCWTCPSGQVHWYDEGTGITTAPGGDRCACVPAPAGQNGCPAGWTKYNDNNMCYRLYTPVSTWTNAKQFCRNQGGFLASITTWKLNSWIDSFVPSNVAEFWIGGSRSSRTAAFKWDSKRDWQYKNFDTNQPASWGNYVSFVHQTGSFGNRGKWRSIGDEYLKPFLCERSA